MADEEKSVASMEPENDSEMADSCPPEETENEFEVEKIIAMVKTKGKKTLYRVRWLGYGPDHDTWEPYENLESCQDMIDQFIENEQKKKKAKYKKKTQNDVQNTVPSGTSSSTSSQHTEKKAPMWKYVAQDEEEYDTLKDKFWRDLEQGKVDVFKAGDMYSKVKASGRASRPKSFADMFKNKLPVLNDASHSQQGGRGRGRGRGSSRGRRKRQKSSDGTNSELSTMVGSGSKRVRHANKSKRGRGRGIRGRGSLMANNVTSRESSVYDQLQDSIASKDHSDSISVASCDTVSSTDTHITPLSEDSSQPYQLDVHEDMVGILPVSSPNNRAYFQQVSLDKLHRTEVDHTDGITDPSSVASSTATSASSANESGIVADSCPERLQSEAGSHFSDASTPKDCSTFSDSLETADFDILAPGQCDLHSTRDSQNRSRDLIDNGALGQSVFGCRAGNISKDCIKLTNTSHIKTNNLQPVTNARSQNCSSSGILSHSSCTMAAPVCIGELSGHHDTRTSNDNGVEQPLSTSKSSASAASSSFSLSTASSLLPSSSVNQLLSDSSNQISLSLPGDVEAEQMPLNQIQPSITTLINDKSLLNNNKGMSSGETGDEEFEFDFDEFDPSEWDGKLELQTPIPDVLELSNAELRLLVQENDYHRLVRALQTNKTYDLEQPDNMGMTLVMIAAQHGFDDILEYLVIKGANVNSELKNGTTALMLACEQGLRCTVALLLMLGAHMNKHNHIGETALIKAVRCGHKHVVKQLLDHGVNFACPYNVDSPLKYAKHQREIFDLFNTHISRVTAEFEHQVQITLNNTAQIICALFPMQCFALREAERFKVIFKHELQPTKPGVGMLLFIAHARITPQEVRCRFYGPCAVLCTVLNGVKLDPLTEGGNFVMSFCPLHNGKNELELLTAKAPTSEAKLIVCAYKAQLI